MRELRRLSVFGLVGIAASLTHLAAAWLVMRLLGESVAGAIFIANLAGFLVAFVVSYLGHYHLTFTPSRAHVQAVPRFLATALIGLGVNNATLWLLVRLSGQAAFGFILVAIAVAAVATYLIAKYWAFSAHGRNG